MRSMTDEEVTERKLALFRMAAQLVSNDATLRARSAPSAEQQRAFGLELGRRDRGFMRVVTVGDGAGTYEARDGDATVTKTFTFSGVSILTPKYEPAASAVTAASSYEAPDPYRREVAARAAASSTELSTFESRWKADRLRDLAAGHERVDAHLAATPPTRMTTAELATARPPDPYAAGIKQLQKENAR